MPETRYVPAPYSPDADELVRCPMCTLLNDTDANFCDQCGAKLNAVSAYAPDADETVPCPECGKMNETDARFCDQCGMNLVGSESPRSERPPRDVLVRAIFPGVEMRAARDGGMPTLVGHFAVFNQWTKIESEYEGTFMERVDKKAFNKTFADNRDAMRVTFQHGHDPQLGDKPLGPIAVLETDDIGARYEVPMLDTAYNRELVPGLLAGLYGSSFRFQVVREDFKARTEASPYNPDSLPERTILEANVMEFGPVTYPAYSGATAGIRSMTDAYLVERLTRHPERFAALLDSMHLASSATVAPALQTVGAEPAHSDDGSRSPAIPIRRFRSREDWLAHLESFT